MKIALVAMSGIRACDEELLRLGLTLPGFVERSKTIASLPSLGLLTLGGMTPEDHECVYMEVFDIRNVESIPNDSSHLSAAEIVPPNHWGYVQFPSLMLIIFAGMFCSITKNPVRNSNLIPYGILLKLSYFGVVIGHYVTHGIPTLWIPFAFIDLVMAILFGWACLTVRQTEK